MCGIVKERRAMVGGTCLHHSSADRFPTGSAVMLLPRGYASVPG